MKSAPATEVIDVQALRVGMFVHLDVGWMAHPFPLSSFRITTTAQVATIQSLGLARVRWNPQQSEPAAAMQAVGQASANDESAVEPATEVTPAPAGASAAASATATATATATAITTATPTATTTATPATASEAEASDIAPAVVATSAAGAATSSGPGGEEARARVEHRARLDAQRNALGLVERQYGEAARACRHALELVPDKPQDARRDAEGLTRALLDKMLGEQDLCIRMIAQGVGDKASMHAMNVAIVSLLMGRCFGFADDELQELGTGAMLHDIGKLDLPPRLRHRDENFAASEVRAYQEHVELGLVQARRMGLSAGAAAIIGQHHEHADGSGFPRQLNSDRMTIGARIVALVNRFDNLCNPHVAARSMTPHESVSLLFAQGRAKYDTSILGAFIKMMGVYPPGSVVQLTDDRYALVVAVNSSRPLRPQVMVFEPRVPREEALILNLENVSGLGIRRSIRPQMLPPPALGYLAPSSRVSYFFEPCPRLEEDTWQ